MLDALEQIIARSYRIFPDNNNLLTIREDKNNSGNSSLGSYVSFKKTGRIFSFTLDIDNSNPFPYFSERTGLKGKNDAIIFAEKDGKIFILLLELKSKNLSTSMKQLRSGENFVQFIVKTIELHFKGAINEQLEFRYLLFTTRKIPKKRTARLIINYHDNKGKKVAEEDSNRAYALVDFLK